MFYERLHAQLAYDDARLLREQSENVYENKGKRRGDKALLAGPRSLQDFGYSGEKAGSALNLRVALCLRFLAAGKAVDQVEEFDLDSELQVLLVAIPEFPGSANSSPGEVVLEIDKHGGVRLEGPVCRPVKCQVLRSVVGENSGLVQESHPGVEIARRYFDVGRNSSAGRER